MIDCETAGLKNKRCVVWFCWANLPASSPTGAAPLPAEGVDELDIVATASSLLAASLDTVIVLVAGFCRFRGRATLCGGTESEDWEQ